MLDNNIGKAVSSKDKSRFEELLAMFSTTSNFKAIRNVLSKVKLPCIPHIGLFMTDLTFIEEGNPKFIKDKINFTKCSLVRKF